MDREPLIFLLNLLSGRFFIFRRSDLAALKLASRMPLAASLGELVKLIAAIRAALR
jgi:hypothetical protein